MKIKFKIPVRLFTKSKPDSPRGRKNLQKSFIIGVLTPPFVVLLVLSLVVLWQLDRVVRNGAIDELSRSASTTAAKLEREFTIRQTVLKRTGEDLFTIKSNYQTNLEKLESDRATCSDYVKKKRTFTGVSGNACDPFLAQFAVKGVNVSAIEEGYVLQGKELLNTQSTNISDRLSAYKQFFPETVGIVILDSDGEVVSSAFSGSLKDPLNLLLSDAKAALKQPVEGKTLAEQTPRLGVFAYPISKGSVLAAYDLDSSSFVKDTWESTPIDRSKALAVILDAEGNLGYPDLEVGDNFKAQNNSLRSKKHVDVAIKNVVNIAAAAESGSSKWLVVVASPKSAVLAPVRDAQLAAVFVIGCLLIGFLWVGTFYIRRMVKSVYGLVGGALVFAGGQLDYKINLRDADEEFNKLAETMNNMAGRIAQAEKEIDEKNKEFISVATHELRTPLTSIIGYLSMAYEDMGDRLDSAVKPLVAQAHNGTVRLRDLVNDMLDVARLEGGRTEFKIVPVDIKAAIERIVDSLQVVAKEKPVTLNYNNSLAAKVMADEAHLGIILNNFVSNAIKYNRSGGTVTVSHVPKDDKLVISVADTGLGIPEDQKTHMFEKFFRVDNADRKNIVGTGLGMYITKQYVLTMGGEVWFESVHGKGTTFHFTLPLAS